MNRKKVEFFGWFASLMALSMYLSYVDLIRLNLNGHSGSLLLPILTTVNCMAWTLYGTFKEKKDWPIIVCNIPGVFLGIATAVTTNL